MHDSPDTRMSLLGRLRDHQNAEAWTEFVQIYQPLILVIARRRGLQHADALEVTQDVLGRVAATIENWESQKGKGAFRGWLYKITRNLTMDHLRKRQRHAGENDHVDWSQVASPAIEDSLEFRGEFERRVFHWAAAIVKPRFAEDNWQAFWRTTVDKVPVEEVADQLAVSRGKVYVARSRVMARIAGVIQERLDETGNLDDLSVADHLPLNGQEK